MSEATSEASFQSMLHPFPRRHIASILHAVLKASHSLKKKTGSDKENWLTRRLHARLIQDFPFRDGPLDIDVQPEVPNTSDIDSDRPVGQIDIKVMCGKGAEVYFALEAKRLRVVYPFRGVDPGAGEYCDDGMMRFVTGQYSPRTNVGGMLGYVFDGDVPTARNDVSRAIARRSDKLKLRDGIGLQPSTILPDRAVDETVHETDKRELTLYHVLIAV